DILLVEVLEHRGLATIHPAREHEQQELKRRDRHGRRSYRADPRPGRTHAERRAARPDPSRCFPPIVSWHRTGSGNRLACASYQGDLMSIGWKTSIAAVVACAAGVAGGVTYAKQARPEYSLVPAGAAKFAPLDPKNPNGVQQAVLSGDP